MAACGSNSLWAPHIRLLLCAILAGACSGDQPGTVVEPELPEGTYFLLGMHGDTLGVEDFVAVTDDTAVTATVVEQLELAPDLRWLHIHGKLGSTNGGFNLDWDWHFIPSAWKLVEMSIEVCDGRPSGLRNLASLLAGDSLFCPWSSYVKKELSLEEVRRLVEGS